MKVGCAYHPRLYAGCGKFHFIHAALISLGHDVTHVQTMDDLRRADETCDFVLFEQRGPASLCIPDLVELSHHKQSVWCQWMFDLAVFDDSLPLEKQGAIEPFLEIMRGMDLVFVKEKDRLIDYRDIGINAVWFDQACPAEMRKAELKFDPEFDVVLWGSSSRPLWRQRWEDVETLIKAGFRVAWATVDGNLPSGVHRLPCCQPLELPEVIETAKVVLVVDARQDVKGYWSDRIWLAAGAGACIVRRMSIGGGNLPSMQYGSDPVLVETVGELCENFTKRRWNGNFARNMVMNGGHTYEARAKDLVRHAENIIRKRHEEPPLPEVHGHKNCDCQGQEDSLSCVRR